jgi:membrane fusion protein (multidrug efflux system)
MGPSRAQFPVAFLSGGLARALWVTLPLVCGAGPALAQGPVRVGVVAAQKKEVTRAADFVGRVQAINKVEIRARVKGYLKSVDFRDGQAVNVGDALYEIEPDLFKADVASAEGALARAQASKTLAALQLKRAQELLTKQAGTAVQRDQAAASDQEAAGAILTAQANLDTARINLGYTTIASPIKGRIGKTNVTVGNVVGPDSGALATVVSEDPIYVSFPVSQREFLQASGEARVDLKEIGVTLTFSDGSAYDQKGRVDFVDVKVDRSTDTIDMRATFPNPTARLKDGQLVRVRLASEKPKTQVVAPQSALLADKDGIYLFVVEDGKAVARRVKTGGEAGNDIVIAEGLSGGEPIIVEGLANVRPGAPVTASPAAQSGS